MTKETTLISGKPLPPMLTRGEVAELFRSSVSYVSISPELQAIKIRMGRRKVLWDTADVLRLIQERKGREQ